MSDGPRAADGLTCPRCHTPLLEALAPDTTAELRCPGCGAIERVPRRAPTPDEARAMARAQHARRSHRLL